MSVPGSPPPRDGLAGLADDWAAIDPLLDEALDLPPVERAAWLAALPAAAAPHRVALARLLAAQPALETDDFLVELPRFGVPRALAHEGAAAGGAADLALAPGSAVGPYRLLEAIGSGGMGAVWLAERSDGQPRRKVALKLPHMGWQPGLAARLERERDILASLEHPNIARLYDAGLDAWGRPYLAMEYVAGTPIDRYVAGHSLALPERLRLVLQVAAAVAHAHGRLVAHRDLKPANILVSEGGEVRLLDFGIARLVEDEAPAESALTRESGRALTPDYASPEQIRGEPVGTASDVYSLGVVAYEVVAGTRPYRLGARGAAALAEAIAAVDVQPASAAATDPALRRAIGGDLDAVLAKALRHDPAERYPTIDAFAADIGRCLRGEPVSAQPDRIAYRLRKFVGRHRWQAASAALALVALVGGAGVALWQAREARQEAARAEQVKAFVLSLLDSADSDAGAGAQTTAVELLQAARKRVESELAGRPGVAAELMTAIGFGLLGQGRAEDAAGLLKNAVALSAAANGSDDRRTLAARVVYGEALVALGKNDEAIRLMRPAAELARSLGDGHAEIDARRWLSSALLETGDIEGGVAAARQAIAVLGPTQAPDRRSLLDAAQAHLALANALNIARSDGLADSARSALRFAQEAASGAASVHSASARSMLGQGLVREGQVSAGLAELEHAYDETRAVLGPDHPQTAITAHFLGNMRLEAGDAAGAVAAFRIAFDAAQRRKGGSVAALAHAHYALAAARVAAGEYEAALPGLAEAARLFAEAGGANATLSFRARSARAGVLARLGRIDEAEREFAALSAMPIAGPDKALHDGRLATLRRLQGRHEEAVRLARSSAEALASFPSGRLRAQTQATLGSALLAAGRPGEAVAPLEAAVALFRAAQPIESLDAAEARAALQRAQAARVQ